MGSGSNPTYFSRLSCKFAIQHRVVLSDTNSEVVENVDGSTTANPKTWGATCMYAAGGNDYSEACKAFSRQNFRWANEQRDPGVPGTLQGLQHAQADVANDEVENCSDSSSRRQLQGIQVT